MGRLSMSRRAFDRVVRLLIWGAAGSTCLLLAALIGWILYRGLPHLTLPLLTQASSVLEGRVGILPDLINTLALVVGTLAVVLPLGVGAAIYLTEYAKSRRVAAVVELAAETLSGLPSILYGLVGMLFFVRILGWGTSLRAGILTLAVMLLPTVMRTTQESLKTVPDAYREAALGLGSGKWRMIRTVVLPGAVDGMVTGCILAAGRVMGESAALLYTAGSASLLAESLYELLTTSGGSLSVALYLFTMERGEVEVGFAIASVLLLLTLLLNFAARMTGKGRRTA